VSDSSVLTGCTSSDGIAFNLVPTRNTSYTHLRDAFVRTLQTRQKLAYQAGKLSTDEQLTLQAPIAQLKTLFPNAPFVKDTPLDIVLTPPDPKQPRALIIRDLGAIQNEWVARELIMSYFDVQGNSPAVRSHIYSMTPLNVTRLPSLNSLSLARLLTFEPIKNGTFRERACATVQCLDYCTSIIQGTHCNSLLPVASPIRVQ
jgi:Chalcone isomerase like